MTHADIQQAIADMVAKTRREGGRSTTDVLISGKRVPVACSLAANGSVRWMLDNRCVGVEYLKVKLRDAEVV